MNMDGALRMLRDYAPQNGAGLPGPLELSIATTQTGTHDIAMIHHGSDLAIWYRPALSGREGWLIYDITHDEIYTVLELGRELLRMKEARR